MSISIKEPFDPNYWPLAWAWADRPGVFDDFGPKSPDEFVTHSASYARTFGVFKDGQLGGAVAIERGSPTVVTAHILLSRRLWGTPAEELRKIAGVLFDSEPQLQRIQAFVPAWNRLAIALCKRLGAQVEATMRSAAIRHGIPANAVVLGLTRKDWARSSAAAGTI